MTEQNPIHIECTTPTRRPLTAATALVLVMLVMATGSSGAFAASLDRCPWGEPRHHEPLRPVPMREGRSPDRALAAELFMAQRMLRAVGSRVRGIDRSTLLGGFAPSRRDARRDGFSAALVLSDAVLALPPPLA